MAAIVGVLFVVDHPRLFPSGRHVVLTLDSAYTDERVLTTHWRPAGCDDSALEDQAIDLVNDTTSVDVRYRLNAPIAAVPASTP